MHNEALSDSGQLTRSLLGVGCDEEVDAAMLPLGRLLRRTLSRGRQDLRSFKRRLARHGPDAEGLIPAFDRTLPTRTARYGPQPDTREETGGEH
jgi:hypothetical protein